jgi:adenosylcobinamide-GDP ribazoletransferase
VKNRLKELQLIAMLLTRVPAGQIKDPLPAMAQAVWAFPVLGAALGAVIWLAFAGANAIGLPPLTAAFLALGLQALLTGGLHEDGLADTADGFGGGHDRDRKLDIMRDSRIGTYGVLALILTLGLTATAMAHTWEHGGNHGRTLAAFLVIGATSRTAMLVPMALLPPARDNGLGHGAALSPGRPVALALAISAVLGLIALPALVAMMLLAGALLALFKAQIGGQTGDTLGATQKLSEMTGWLTIAALAA